MGKCFCVMKHIHNGVRHLQMRHWGGNPQRAYSPYVSPGLVPKMMMLQTSVSLTSKPQNSYVPQAEGVGAVGSGMLSQ